MVDKWFREEKMREVKLSKLEKWILQEFEIGDKISKEMIET